MEKKIKILAVQMEAVIADKYANFDKLLKLIPNNTDVDLVILPELWSVGWACDRFVESAEQLETSEIIDFLSNIAKDKKVNILGGSFIRKERDNYYNTCPVINSCGELIAVYDKNHLFSYYDDCENKYITAGKNPVIVDINGIKIGLSICYDIRFPEIYRAYRKSGADLLVNMAAWPLSRQIHWDTLTRARAIENQTYMVALTQTGVLPTGAKNLGHSLIYDYSGNILSEINNIEGCMTAELNMEEMYKFREKCTILNDIKQNYEVVFQ